MFCNVEPAKSEMMKRASWPLFNRLRRIMKSSRPRAKIAAAVVWAGTSQARQAPTHRFQYPALIGQFCQQGVGLDIDHPNFFGRR